MAAVWLLLYLVGGGAVAPQNFSISLLSFAGLWSPQEHHTLTIIMASTVSFVARSFARRSFDKIVRANIGSVACFSTKFTKAHEYIKVDGKTGICGISDYAQHSLGDIVHVDLPEVGEEFGKGDAYGSVESVKAVSDVYAPVGGTVTEVNEKLLDEPGVVNTDAEGDAWLIKLEIDSESDLDDLLDAAAYKEHCEKEP